MPKSDLKYFRLEYSDGDGSGDKKEEKRYSRRSHMTPSIIILVVTQALYVLYNKAAVLLKVRNYSHCSKKGVVK